MPVPGVSHLIHGVLSGANSGMAHYPKFLKQLKTCEKILQHPGRKERLQATCMMGTPFADYIPCIQSFAFTLHEPRWHATSGFCAAAIKPLAILRKCWSAIAYEAKGIGTYIERTFEEQADRRFVPADLTTLLKQSLFRSYMHMILEVHHIGKRGSAKQLQSMGDCVRQVAAGA